jgi:AcrR family transcriptional regulator
MVSRGVVIMSVSKQEIVRSATKLFMMRGFLSTSIQDIADDCHIAKGSVYKYFPSKEDLFSEVFDHCLIVYFEQVEKLKHLHLSPREHFIQQIIFRFQYFVEFKFILVAFTEIPIQQDVKFHQLRLRYRVQLMELHKECLLQIYGKEITPHLWDLVFIYKAILKEYLSLLIYEMNPVSFEETARFILEKLDMLMNQMVASGSKPLLQQFSFDQFIHGGIEGRKAEKEQIIAELLGKISDVLSELPSGDAHRRELQEILTLLRMEMSKSESNGPLLQALLAYLEKESDLKSLVVQLKNLLGGAFRF